MDFPPDSYLKPSRKRLAPTLVNPKATTKQASRSRISFSGGPDAGRVALRDDNGQAKSLEDANRVVEDPLDKQMPQNEITPPGAAEDEVFSTDLDESALDDLNSLANALDEDPGAKKIKAT
ncbi:Hypothetical protein FKW44_012661, partial [Caligus rogercresseyi]